MSDEDLVRRFAPILFLHPQEKLVPVDAKRFVEHAALWSATTPFDDKTMWGVPGTAPLLRQPNIAAAGLSAATGEPGKIIDDASLRPMDSTTEMFLELGGWKTTDGAHEPGITSSSTTVYGDRGEIAGMYASGPLADSRFWYHAEIYQGARLKDRLKQAGPPDMSPLITDNSALLCYYLFFPTHQQSIDGGTPVAAAEEACHAGDWQCVAILLEGDGTGVAVSFKPTFFGCTGVRPAPPAGSSVFRPFQFDDDNLTVMKVERWRPSSGPAAQLPAVETGGATPDGLHPHLFVALGSHSLYTQPGNQDVFPFPDGQGPQWFGTFDTPSVMPNGFAQPPDRDTALDIGAFFAKVLGGLSNFGPLGGIAGLVSAASEGAFPPAPGSGLDVVGTADTPDPDQVPAPGAGLTIKPKELAAVTGAGISVSNWAAQQGLRLNGRTYDYLVDRNKQRYWPNDDNESGFRGRWGQRVTPDFLPRRSGPRFPDYLKLFFLALAAGDAAGAYKDR